MWKLALERIKTDEFKRELNRELKFDILKLATGLAIMFVIYQFISVEIYWHWK